MPVVLVVGLSVLLLLQTACARVCIYLHDLLLVRLILARVLVPMLMSTLPVSMLPFILLHLRKRKRWDGDGDMETAAAASVIRKLTVTEEFSVAVVVMAGVGA
jgi:hypothetical protein